MRTNSRTSAPAAAATFLWVLYFAISDTYGVPLSYGGAAGSAPSYGKSSYGSRYASSYGSQYSSSYGSKYGSYGAKYGSYGSGYGYGKRYTPPHYSPHTYRTYLGSYPKVLTYNYIDKVSVPHLPPVHPLPPPAHPAPPPLQPAGIPLQPSGFPLQPSGLPLQPLGVPLQPTGLPLQPTGLPLQPSGGPLQPSGLPLQPSGLPLQPTGLPLQPSGVPLQPSAGFPGAAPRVDAVPGVGVESGARCDPGYIFDSLTASCLDVDECGSAVSTCSERRLHGDDAEGGTSVRCINTIGSYMCVTTCPHGSVEAPRCAYPERCINMDGSYTCAGCVDGYQLSESGDSKCVPVIAQVEVEVVVERPVVRGTAFPGACGISTCEHTCEPHVDGGSHVCRCAHGYHLLDDGRHCADIDECADSPPCDQTCVNMVGGYKCMCEQPGYTISTHDWITCLPQPTATATHIPNVVVQGTIPNVVQGTIPNVVQGTIPNVVQGTIPNVVHGTIPNVVVQGTIPNVVQGTIPNVVVQGITPNVVSLHGTDPNVKGTIPNIEVIEEVIIPNNIHQRIPNVEVIEGRIPEVVEVIYESIPEVVDVLIREGAAGVERSAPRVNPCESVAVAGTGTTPCQHICIDVSATAYRCECGPGYLLAADGVSCEDIDECQAAAGPGSVPHGGCQHLCTNEVGTYRCHCLPGFTIDTRDWKSCVPLG